MNNAEALLAAAREAAEQAHCPYSNFHVGAAVRCSDGTVVTGCNVENASYGLTICAERVSLFNCVAQGLQPLELAVSCVDAQNNTSLSSRMPCGACRQVMQELLPNNAIVHIDGVGQRRINQLLPEGFGLN
ncbi:cytidine deaminase [Synechococcus sp. WH 8103]|uniref:Cytidine deaminase n=1 Tax=Parasynechococcus marenigrum (strain WH8102) TaxID=84588 RepID=Q7U596_PARMW|nr:cytidine deaminase [Parasynechococcus marenigrum]QNI51811.1 cytidine deaminase [Synechococcus sp. RS9915]QNI92322.1 cytidine deaminase [Synechococcus sp. BOUM118]QNJ14742.1 cytidine deaminase [Synechococcus sp. A18-46.1]CRY92784.1 cytidine deaminase [Synechococcus sp. WH 8103]CAE08326.1 putative cytidine/deoxycytidine deaminase [Parasynechococcus marenigrum WH 8102]